MVNTPHKHTHKGFTCSKQFRLLGHRLQFKLLPFLLFWILRRRHFCFYTPWCLLTNVTVKSSLCWCHLSAGTCRLTGQIRQLLLALLTDEATQNQHPKWRRKQMDIPTCFFKRKTTRGRWCTWLRGRCMTFSDKPSTVLLSRKTINKEIIKTKGFNFSEMEIKPCTKSFENLLLKLILN